MHLLATIIGTLIPTAFAQGAQTQLSQGSGVSQMWSMICSVLPCSVAGTSGTGLIAYFAGRIVLFLNSLIGVVSVILVIYAGIKIISSHGNEEGVSQGKNILRYVAIGLLLYVLAFAIISFVSQFLQNALS
ncbi:MAG TPA: hypothetical protein VHA78_03870 [Candidatus Peribacteraceae bacterium]|nr:hypothetical protein [Candidatus Peribacteraceae bacterium]